ncbi:MAG: hypothetical protein ACK5H2_01805 [Beutenbergiaceae bacterium]
MKVGVAQIDITPQQPAHMAGYAARTMRSTSTSDPLQAIALAIDEVAIVALDLIALSADDCARIESAVATAGGPTTVLVHTTHTHSGPVATAAGLGQELDVSWLERVLEAVVRCVLSAAASARRALLQHGEADPPGVAMNRRDSVGPVDARLPVLRFTGQDGRIIATVVGYACHPVILDALNTSFSADYPGAVRRYISATTHAPTLFLTGCAGDAAAGQNATGSFSLAPDLGRSTTEVERVGALLGRSAVRAPLSEPRDGAVTAVSIPVQLSFDAPTHDQLRAEISQHETGLRTVSDKGEAAVLQCWSDWAHEQLHRPPAEDTWRCRVSVVALADTRWAFLPGEPFAALGMAVRERTGAHLVSGYTDGVAGYVAPAHECGGYELLDAHRYYAMPGPFAPGSGEALVDAAITASRSLPG